MRKAWDIFERKKSSSQINRKKICRLTNKMYLQCKKKNPKGKQSGPNEKPSPSFPLKVK